LGDSINQAVVDIFAGVVAGVVNIIYSISYAALIFSGPLAEFLPFGISSALITATVTATIMALGSSFRFGAGGPDSDAAAFMALIVATLTGNIVAAGATQTLLPTTMLLLTLSAIAASAVVFITGRLHLGRWVRFVPYPVIGGFLASSGWLFTRGAFVVMADTPLGPTQLGVLAQPHLLIRWLPGLFFALVILFVTQRFTHFLVLPTLTAGAIVVFYLLLWILEIDLQQANQLGWLFDPFGQSQFWLTELDTLLTNVHWSALAQQGTSVAALILVVAIVLLLNATGIELETEQDANLDQELQLSGLANLANGLLGGFIGSLSLSRTLLNHQAGGRTRLSGLVVALLGAAALFGGVSLVGYLPKPFLGGMLLYVGISLLFSWLYKTWFQLSQTDYALIWFILITVATLGILEGIGLGIVIACLIFTLTYSRLSVIKHELTGAEYQSNRARPFQQQQALRTHGQHIHILWLQGYLFFGTATTLLDHIQTRLTTKTLPAIHFLILDFREVSGLDASALLSFVKLQRVVQNHQIKLIYSDLSPDIYRQFQLQELITKPEEPDQTFADMDHALEWCEEQLLAQAHVRRSKTLPLALQLAELFPDSNQLSQFMAYLEPGKYPAGHQLITKGVTTEALYFVEYGQITVVGELADGQTRRIRTMGAGTIFGELGLYRRTPPMASVVTDQPVRLYRLTREALERMETEHPALAATFNRYIARLIAERLAFTNETVELLLS